MLTNESPLLGGHDPTSVRYQISHQLGCVRLIVCLCVVCLFLSLFVYISSQTDITGCYQEPKTPSVLSDLSSTVIRVRLIVYLLACYPKQVGHRNGLV